MTSVPKSHVVGTVQDTCHQTQNLDLPVTDTACAICRHPYTDPRLLSCLHSFCKTCLAQLQNSSLRTIKCPLCRNSHSLSTTGVDGLLPNTHLTVAKPTISKQCGLCHSSEQVVSFCSECNDYLCDLCNGAHKRMSMFSSHKLVPPGQARQKLKMKSFMCPNHPQEILKVYCTFCKTVICRDCALYSHHGHKFKPAEEATEEIKKSLRSDCKHLKSQLTTFRSHAQAVAKVEKHVTTYPDKMKAFITSHFNDLSQQLERRKQTLLKEVHTQYDGFSKCLWAEKDTVEMAICSIEVGVKFANQLLTGTDKLEVAVLGSQALVSLQKAKTLSWNPDTIKDFGPLVY